MQYLMKPQIITLKIVILKVQVLSESTNPYLKIFTCNGLIQHTIFIITHVVSFSYNLL